MAQYLCPPEGSASIAPSFRKVKRGVGTNNHANAVDGVKPSHGVTSEPDGHASTVANPTVLPENILKQFRFVFLIRNPRKSVPSYYRCTVPPLLDMTGFEKFMPSEAGYRELRLIFDYLHSTKQIGPAIAGRLNARGNEEGKPDICVVDADDLLDSPSDVIKTVCKSSGLEYDPSMLSWNTDADRAQAETAFAKWRGFHEDAIGSTGLKPRDHVSPKFLPR